MCMHVYYFNLENIFLAQLGLHRLTNDKRKLLGYKYHLLTITSVYKTN